MRRFCESLPPGAFAILSLVLLAPDLRAEEPTPAPLATAQVEAVQAPFYLGRRTTADLPALTDEELSTPQQQRLVAALGGDPFGQRACDHICAGNPTEMRAHAVPSNNCNYGGYLVGGGLPVKGDGPFLGEGTFGWDYFGIYFTKRVALNWSHGARYQSGTGNYKTDGPKLKRE